MRILIIGAGAVGCFLGARLAAAGQAVTLVGRPKLAEAVAARGLIMIEPGGSRRTVSVAAVSSLAAAFAAGQGYDLAFVTVKAYDTGAVLAEIEECGASAFPPTITFQNGIGNEEAIAAVLGADAVMAGAINTPVSQPEPGQVQAHRATYKIGVAPVGRMAPVAEAAAILRAAGSRVAEYDDYRGLKWSKLLMNLPANAACAILDWTPAQVMAHPVAARLEAQAWQEALAVMAALRIRPVALAGYPFPLLAPLARLLPPGWLARGLRFFVAGGRGTKMPSFYISLGSGRPSEVASLNGAVGRFGQRAGIVAPVNTALTAVLSAMTDGQMSRDEWRGRPDRLAQFVRARTGPSQGSNR